MNLNAENDHFVAIPEPSINDTKRINIGQGTVGLGAYASPLEQAAKNCMIKDYLVRTEEKRERTLAHRSHDRAMRRRTSYFQAAAEERRHAKVAHHEQREAELQVALEERQHQHHVAQIEREKQREQRKELTDILATRKQQHREASKLAKEERRRNYEHGMMERRERQQQERDTVMQERDELQEAQERRAAIRREQALESKRAAIDAVKEMKAKQKAEAQARKAQLDKKLEERRAGYAKDLQQNIHQIHVGKSSHARRMMELSQKMHDERTEIVESTRLNNAVPLAEKILGDREKKNDSNKARAAEIRRARSVMW